MKCHPRPCRQKCKTCECEEHHLFFFFSLPLFLFVRWLFLLYYDVSGINHHSEDENQPPAAPRDDREQIHSYMLRGESYSCFQIVCRSFNPAWTNYLLQRCGSHQLKREFTRLIHNVKMIHANQSSSSFIKKKWIKVCHQKSFHMNKQFNIS